MLDKAKHNVKHNVKLNVMTLGHSTVIDGDYLPRATEEDHDAATTAVKVNAAIPVRAHECVIGSPTVAVRGHIAGAGLLASWDCPGLIMASTVRTQHFRLGRFSAGAIYRLGRGIRSTWRQSCAGSLNRGF
jgi:hypothetical protein